MPLPPLPRHTVSVVGEKPTAPDEAHSFLRVRHQRLVATFANGSVSGEFAYDSVHRERLDAVVVVPHFKGSDGMERVVLRSALRPPVALRPLEARPVPERDSLGGLWEVIAGLVEPDERSPEGLLACAARELLEEAGFEVAPSALEPLGPSSFPAPGIIGERHFYFHVPVDPSARVPPTEDGSVLEQHAEIVDIPLLEALDLCRAGEIEDTKTELALRRLVEV